MVPEPISGAAAQAPQKPSEKLAKPAAVSAENQPSPVSRRTDTLDLSQESLPAPVSSRSQSSQIEAGDTLRQSVAGIPGIKACPATAPPQNEPEVGVPPAGQSAPGDQKNNHDQQRQELARRAYQKLKDSLGKQIDRQS